MNKLQLYYPVKPMILTQKFGETALLQYYKDNGIPITSHNGQDLATPYGHEVRAAHDGTCFVEVDSKQGHGVIIRSLVSYDSDGKECFVKTIYWHLIDNIPVKNGQVVKAGEIVGYADSTGLSTGNHLHFGLKPQIMGEPNNTWYNVEQNNGTFGAIDPAPYYNGLYAADINSGKYIFNTDMKVGDTNGEVKPLQEKLRKLGYFPMDQSLTYFYGAVTRAAVFAFQKDYVALSWIARNVYKGRYCSQQTRAALNNL